MPTDTDDRLREWLAEVTVVRLLRRRWTITQVARATGVNRDLVRSYGRTLLEHGGADQSPAEVVGPPPRVVDRELAALKARVYGRLSGVDAP